MKLIRKAPKSEGQIVGSVTSKKQRSGLAPKTHGGVVHVPVVADQLGEDDQEGEGGALDRVGGDGRIDVAGEARGRAH